MGEPTLLARAGVWIGSERRSKSRRFSTLEIITQALEQLKRHSQNSWKDMRFSRSVDYQSAEAEKNLRSVWKEFADPSTKRISLFQEGDTVVLHTVR